MMSEPPNPSINPGTGPGPRCENCGSNKYTRITGYNQSSRKVKIHCDGCGKDSEIKANY